MNTSTNILIGGEAGQGLVTIGELLSKVLVRAGYNIVVTQSYQSRVRGGHNTFAIRVSDKEISAPKESVDILVALNEETVNIHKASVAKEGIVISSDKFKSGEGVLRPIKVPYEKFGSAKLENVASLGVVCSILGVEKGHILKLLNDRFGKKGSTIAKDNENMLNASYDWAAGQNIVFNKSPKVKTDKERYMMNGNEAIALGAISAGVKFAAFYPMTPSTSVNLSLISHAKETGMVVEQAEDEIAAINMAIGASYAGAPSMVATSGGGFALMVEGASLAGMTETPVVVVVAQRPGPATGLPTRTEQADLEFVLYSGHGEFPRAIFTPGTVEECFHLTRRAFELAEKYQGPVFILTDQYLADSFRAVDKFDGNLSRVKAGVAASEVKAPYMRYALTDNGISPRLIPGSSKHLVVAGSDEHTEGGHLTEDLDARVKMVDKRLKKMEGLSKEVSQPEYFGDASPDKLFISFGSAYGAALEAVKSLNEKGGETALLNFSQVWPLVPSTFIDKLNSAKEVVAIEGNATGQLAGLIRKTTGFEIKNKILRYDGLPITPEYILNRLAHGEPVEP
ncbi:MAG: pyruvate ferredoxin oxidoreductase [Deltaproteobacteria bacterium CG11_big_fil_rev_8_21_14_0_20_49_13]|nr:MAG: pyruvate ferredoxin oxidoreductase [Deltaproteobacteria bacterium CG11_big_fil_rev_8_21_14_0_20_49_13]